MPDIFKLPYFMFITFQLLLRHFEDKAVAHTFYFYRRAINHTRAVFEFFRSTYSSRVKYGGGISVFSNSFDDLYVTGTAIGGYRKLYGDKAFQTALRSTARILRRHFHNRQVLTITAEASEANINVAVYARAGHIQPLRVNLGHLEIRLRNIWWRRLWIVGLIRLGGIKTGFDFRFGHHNVSNASCLCIIRSFQVVINQQVH